MQNDPYTPPATNGQEAGLGGDSQVSQAVLHQLAGTKPWVRFMSVLMFVGAGLMLLVAVVIALAGSQISRISAASGGAPMFSGMMGLVIAVIYGVLSLVYIYPALKLWNYASRIGDLLMTGSEQDLVNALSQQRSFWKFIGILVLAMFVLYFIGIAVMIAIGGIAAMNGQH
ncbi:MAG: DUF5362 family protein [Luteolibacter sp.]